MITVFRALLIIAAACLLVGCSPAPITEETKMTPDESKAVVVKLFDETVKTIGGVWKFDPVSAESCDLVGGGVGVTFVMFGLASGFPDPDAAAFQVAEYWKSAGYPSQVTHDALNTTTTTYRDPGTGMSFRFETNTLGADLTGVSLCVSGDEYKINTKILKDSGHKISPPIVHSACGRKCQFREL